MNEKTSEASSPLAGQGKKDLGSFDKSFDNFSKERSGYFDPPLLNSIDYEPGRLYSPLGWWLFHREYKSGNKIRVQGVFENNRTIAMKAHCYPPFGKFESVGSFEKFRVLTTDRNYNQLLEFTPQNVRILHEFSWRSLGEQSHPKKKEVWMNPYIGFSTDRHLRRQKLSFGTLAFFNKFSKNNVVIDLFHNRDGRHRVQINDNTMLTFGNFYLNSALSVNFIDGPRFPTRRLQLGFTNPQLNVNLRVEKEAESPWLKPPDRSYLNVGYRLDAKHQIGAELSSLKVHEGIGLALASSNSISSSVYSKTKICSRAGAAGLLGFKFGKKGVVEVCLTAPWAEKQGYLRNSFEYSIRLKFRV